MAQDDLMPMLAQTYVDTVSGTKFELVNGNTNGATMSTSDADLARLIHFAREIGHGNWGSVWQGRQRANGSAKLAIKLVHRTKSATSNIRVKALWTEYK